MRRERGPFRYQRLQVLEGFGNDAYRPAGKPAGTMLCPRCRAVFRRGRWRWEPAPARAVQRRCPACRRIDESFPAGTIDLSGGFFRAHRAEILARVVHCAEMERAEHPLERIMAIRDTSDGLRVTTTSVHLARLVGHALKSAFKGSMRIAYNAQDNVARVRWSRDT